MTTLQLDLHLDASSVWRIFLQDLNSSGSSFFRISSLQDPDSLGFCAKTFFMKTFISSMFLNNLRGRHWWLNTSSGTVLLCILTYTSVPQPFCHQTPKPQREGT